MEVPQHFCVRWNSYKSNLQTAFPKLLTSEHFVDVTLACEKQFIKCHKIVLSACSVYFETLLVNNPCQHPIIFMKDVEFWEIKALVEFMYKGEVNVSQNQLDSLLKSAESLQIRGLSGTKQFVNFEQSDDSQSDCKSKRNKSDNEDEDEGCKKRKKKNEDDEKCVQITSVRGGEDFLKEDQPDSDDEPQMVIKEETIEGDYDYENTFMDAREEEEGEAYSRDVFYPDHSSDPGPSGISGVKSRKRNSRIIFSPTGLRLPEMTNGFIDFHCCGYVELDLCSLALNHVECVMDQEKMKSASPTNPAKTSVKCQQRHHEHNYTNPPKDEGALPRAADATNDAGHSDPGDGHRLRNSGSRAATASQPKSEANQRQATQPSSTTPSDKQPLEAKSKVIKKDVFNRIRRSEEELQKAAEMVRGGMTFQTASDTFNIPISTIRFYMARRGILPQRRRGRGSSGVRDDDLIHPPFEIIHYRLPDIDKPL